MKGISKTMLRTFAGVAIAAAAVVGGAGVASAAPVTPTATTSSHFGFGCNPFAREQWNLSGFNQVEVEYHGQIFTYHVSFDQQGNCLFGTLTDPYFPTTGPISGTINGNYVEFSFRYPFGSVQGTRIYNGSIGHHGFVSGFWYETGSEHGSGYFSLARDAHRVFPF